MRILTFKFLGVALWACITCHAQSVTISEERMVLDTYGFGKPNPVPIVAHNPKIVPYHKFEQYAHKSVKKEWQVVILENDYIKVFVLPEIGGKVWGAIEKSTGHEFIYKNEVVKFRNIAMRGPWTSGGIEFNFGIIGHHPATATPVNYLTRTNVDGSVSCVVGSTDLPSNTVWTVEIRLEKDKAFFETKASWYNKSNLAQSYYNWMTAAAEATYDLEFFIPGDKYVEHNGDAHPWPIDQEGRNLSMYKNNTFGPSKSYHIVGEYNDFFGGYYHDRKFGFGQWAPYEEMPGQKLWLWDLSRSGGIWEDLLTDGDGQYIEFQAGRLFDQYSPGAINPISQVGFDPLAMDEWSEIWFPFKDIGGMVDASKHGVLNVGFVDDKAVVGLNALQNLNQILEIKVNGATAVYEKLDLKPMQVFTMKVNATEADSIEIAILGTELKFSNKDSFKIKRPFYPDAELNVSASEQLFQDGLESLEFREFEDAYVKFSELALLDPSHRNGLVKLAELEYRKGNFEKALERCNAVLKMDTYDPGANYMAGLTYLALDDAINALESLGWSARDMKYRSASYTQMAEIYLRQKNLERAKNYAHKALDFNAKNVNALELLLILARLEKDDGAFEKYTASLALADPLNLLATYEFQLFKSKGNDVGDLLAKKTNDEFKDETYLNLAIRYYQLGLGEAAISILQLAPRTPKNLIWLAYLKKDDDVPYSDSLLDQVIDAPIDMVFPYRIQSLPVLKWATEKRDNWKLYYYLAHNYLAIGSRDLGIDMLYELGDRPNPDIFYRFRAAIPSNHSFEKRQHDYSKALQLQPKDWKVWEENILFHLQNQSYTEALRLSKKAYQTFTDNYNIGLAHANALLNTKHYDEVLRVLSKIQVLPYEHASESRQIYDRAHLALAINALTNKNYAAALGVLQKAKEWPEHIGVGKPYAPDERAIDYLLATCNGNRQKPDGLNSILTQVLEYTVNHAELDNVNHVFGLLAAKKLGDQVALQQLISNFKLEGGPTKLKTQLAIALFEENQERINSLFNELDIAQDTREVLQKAIRL